MTGASIVRWERADAVVLAVHGSFDGASAWALRNEMDESNARSFLVDLTHAVEAFDFAASVLAAWANARRRHKQVRFLAGTPQHARIIAAHGLELVDDDGDPLEVAVALPIPRSGTPTGVPA